MTRERALRKIDQCYELAGCASQDNDQKDSARWLEYADRYRKYLRSELTDEEEKDLDKL